MFVRVRLCISRGSDESRGSNPSSAQHVAPAFPLSAVLPLRIDDDPAMTRAQQVVFITGATGDIGRSLALEFAQSGAALALCDLATSEDAAPLLAEVRQRGGRATYGRVDVTDAVAVATFVSETVKEFGRIDLCIANAGIVERGGLLELSLDAWRRTLDVNLTGCFITAQAAARAMVQAGRGGQVIFIGSWVQDVPRENIGAYCAAKGGLKMLAKCLALELAPRGIRVNTVAPGWVDAGLTGKNLQVNPQRRAQLERQIPLGRLASAEEVARTVRLLSSADAAYLTGTTLLVDGGSSLGFGG